MIIKGFDTLEFGLKMDNYEVQFRKYLDMFKELKEQSHEMGIEPTLFLNDVSLTVHRTGKRFYPYRLSCDDFTIFFADKELKSNPPIFVHFLSGYIWSYGVSGAFEKFISWIESLNVSLTGNQLSRVDICADSDLVTFRQADIKGVITRARNKGSYFVDSEFTSGRRFSGFTVGRGGVLSARIYNKSLELINSSKEWFKQLWLENGWTEEKEVWRVEFQLRREVLKEFRIDTLEELIENESSLWVYLTEEWLTINQPSKDNVSRWKLKRKWKVIQRANINYLASPLVRKRVMEGNLQRLLDQGTGILLSVAAIGDHGSIEDTAQVFKSWAEIKLDKKNTSFCDEKERRQKKYLLTE